MIVEHYWQNDQIFGENWFTYQNLYKSVVEEFSEGSKFVEVGCWKGRSSSFLAVEIANSQKEISFYCVDTWKDEQQNASCLYETFIENMKPVEKYYFPLKLSSSEASNKFKDKSLDFVFLDASHEYEDIKKDIREWLPKIKPGGILAGHDYYLHDDWFSGIKQAVNEEISTFIVENNCWIYRVSDNDYRNKLKNFPKVNYISVKDDSSRRDLLKQKFEEYGISEDRLVPHIFERYKEEDHNFKSNFLDQIGWHRLSIGSRAPLTSHLKAIYQWYTTTDEPYTFFCEDDLGLNTVKYWNFTWEEFFNNLPPNWGCVQLVLLREIYEGYVPGFKFRSWDDWSACAYLISREHAKKLIENYYCSDTTFNIDLKGYDVGWRPEWAKIPVVETMVFSPLTDVYVCPLFVEDVVNCSSTYLNLMGLSQGQCDNHHYNAYEGTINWWVHVARHMTLDELTML